MVRTYATVNATTSRVGELFDFVVKESEQAARRSSANNGPSTVTKSSTVSLAQSRPVSDISLGASFGTSSNRPNTVPLETKGGWPTETSPPRQPINLPPEEAIFVEPVFGGNTRRQNPSYYDYERQMRDQDRQQRQAYMRDLQRQLEEQRENRLRNEIAMGGHEFERELLKHQRQRSNSYSNSRNQPEYALANNPMGQNGAGFGYSLGMFNLSIIFLVSRFLLPDFRLSCRFE